MFVSPSKNKIESENLNRSNRNLHTLNKSLSKTKIKPSELLQKDIYFCHYKNAMYMGGSRAFQKHGRGIILHDNGTSVITSYFNNALDGDNIFITKNGNLISATYSRNKIQQIVYKNKNHVVYLKYKNQFIDGQAILVNYVNNEISYVQFHKGQITERTFQRDLNLLNRVFQMENLDHLLPKRHTKNLDFEFQPIKNLEVIKKGTKIIIGFSKNGFFNGLGFTLLTRMTGQAGSQLILQLSQRGYYKNSQLNGIGQRRYQNENVYIGQFTDNIFQGNGILLNLIKNNWVYGMFQKGNLIDMIQYNNETEMDVTNYMLSEIHRKKSNWVDQDINILTEEPFQKVIRKIEVYRGDQLSKNLENKKLLMLKKIQQNFIPGSSNLNIQSQLQTTVKQPINIYKDSSRKQINVFQFENDQATNKFKLKPSQQTLLQSQNKQSKYLKSRTLQQQSDVLNQNIKEKAILSKKGGLFKNQLTSSGSKKQIFAKSNLKLNLDKPNPKESIQKKITFNQSNRQSEELPPPSSSNRYGSPISSAQRTLSTSKRNRIFQSIDNPPKQFKQIQQQQYTQSIGVNKESEDITDSKKFLGKRSRIFNADDKSQSAEQSLPTFKYVNENKNILSKPSRSIFKN